MKKCLSHISIVNNFKLCEKPLFSSEVNVQSKNDVQLIFKSESVHKQYHTQYVYQGSGGGGTLIERH
jgi:hypothetical protein